MSALKFSVFLCSLFAPLLLLSQAQALPQFQGIVRQAYTLKPNGVIASAVEKCALCHAGAPPKLNLYGTNVKAALTAANAGQNLTPAILHSIDAQDSDNDGASNGDEFAVDTLPGDPTSKPAPKPLPIGGAKPTVAANVVAASVSHAAAPPKSLFGEMRELMFPKHAQHPVIVHFPIALFFVSLLFDFLGYWKKNETLMQAGYFNLIVAALSSLASLVTGVLAWQFAYGAAPLTGNLLLHLILSLVTSLLLWLLWLVRSRQRGRMGMRVSRMYAAISLIAVATMAVTGHLGGILSGVNAGN